MKRLSFLAVLLSLSLCIFLSCDRTTTPETTGTFSFVIISDVHVPTYGFPINQPLDDETLMQMHNPKRLRQFVGECLNLEPRPDFLVNCGDTGDVGWKRFLNLYTREIRPLVDADIPVYTVVGNHDLDYAGIAALDLAEIFDPLGPAQIGRHGTRYSFDYGGCHFVIINNRPVTGLIRLNPEELAWFREDLKIVDRETRVMLFLHANMQEDDMHRVVEILQPFKYPLIFQGHRHSTGMGNWGGIPVVLTGSLYGGTPEAGSYRIINVTPDGITARTRDFAEPEGSFGPEETITFQEPGPELRITEPRIVSIDGGSTTIKVETIPSLPGAMEYHFSGFTDWTSMSGTNGIWEATADIPDTPGRHFLSVRFTGDNGSVMLAHKNVTVLPIEVHEAWTKVIGSALMGKPVIDEDIAVFPAVEGGVYAVRLENGEEVWHNEIDSGQIIGGIVREDDIVCYGAGRMVCACDMSTGKELWRTPLEGTVVAALTAGNGRIFVPAGESALYCLDARSGAVLWEYAVPLPVMMHAATDGERVYFGAMDGFIRALDAATGDEVWSYPMSSPDDSYTTASFWPPVVAADRIVISKIPASNDEKNIVAFSASDGSVLWSARLNGATYRLTASPDGSRIYAYSRNKNGSGLQCLSAKNGSLVWNQPDSAAMNAGFAVGDVVIVRDGYTTSCVDATAGNVIWTYRTSTGPQGSYYGPGAMAAYGRRAVVGTMDGYLLALEW